MRILLFVIPLLFPLALWAQSTNEALAQQYFQNGEYEKAAELFEDLLKANPGSEFYYSYYIDCLINAKNYKQAQSFLQKRIRKYAHHPEYQIDLAYVYQMAGDERKSNKIKDAVLKNLVADQDYISKVANGFMKRNNLDYAITCYEKGRKILLNENAFRVSLANLYQKTGNYSKMLNEYYETLLQNPQSLESIQNSLQDFIFEDKHYDLVKNETIKAVQKSNYNAALVNFLSWIFIQNKDFESAYRQQIALDKRFGNNKQGLVKLADVCIDNKAFDYAVKIYNYIVSQGPATPYFYHSKFGLIEVSYQNLLSEANPKEEDIKKIEKDYTSFLKNNFYQYIQLSEQVILHLANIKAVYLHNPKDAIALLNRYLKVPQISRQSQAKFKILLGDYYVLTGDIWEATLLYKQVDKDFKDNPVAYEAKYHDAMLAFYRGEFDYAKDYLNVLKGATSELIANDAVKLSLLIQDNMGIDSNENALLMYARASFFLFKNEYDSANFVIDSLLTAYPYHSIADESYFLKAQSYHLKKQNEEALKYYQKVYEEYPDDILADDALFESAILLEGIAGRQEEAYKLFEKIILDYPGSTFVVDSRKHYQRLKSLINKNQPTN